MRLVLDPFHPLGIAIPISRQLLTIFEECEKKYSEKYLICDTSFLVLAEGSNNHSSQLLILRNNPTVDAMWSSFLSLDLHNGPRVRGRSGGGGAHCTTRGEAATHHRQQKARPGHHPPQISPAISTDPIARGLCHRGRLEVAGNEGHKQAWQGRQTALSFLCDKIF